MRRHILFPNLRLCHALLVRAHRRNNTQRPGVDLSSPVANNTYHDLFPPIHPPGLAAVPLTQMRDILDNTMNSLAEEFRVFVIHGDGDEQLCSAWGVVVNLTKSEARVYKVVGAAGGGGVSHVGKFAFGVVCAHVKELCRDGAVDHKVTVVESG